MTEISRSALLPYSNEQVYHLINDVLAYPQYMEGCIGSEILHQDDDVMEARLDLSKAGFTYSLTTRNRLQSPNTVEMQLVNGPFKEFTGQWTVTALEDSACKVELKLQFSLDNRALMAATKVLFNPMADRLVEALVKRAHQLYQ